jgi:hypothetical protein
VHAAWWKNWKIEDGSSRAFLPVVFQRAEPIVRGSHSLRRLRRPFVHYRDAGMHGNLIRAELRLLGARSG